MDFIATISLAVGSPNGRVPVTYKTFTVKPVIIQGRSRIRAKAVSLKTKDAFNESL